MDSRYFDQPGLDSFWEQADVDESGEHPIERELCDHLDALARYRQLINDAIANGRDDAVNILLEQHEREEQVVRRLHGAWRQLRDHERELRQTEAEGFRPVDQPVDQPSEPPLDADQDPPARA